ncbi:DNA repair protein RecO [Pararhodonellum marinum]|uniref:DNA repair protein RecO n=1 Tax=Pararhodonellum marinum TaxID=2755358 RepID=UPI00188E74AB|nr:DNA repair protein RecO [Pararhodonellum marinum]
MLKKTRGIVINYIKFRETSIIVKIFTRDLGLKSYIVNGVRSSKTSSKISFFQPMSLLDLVVYDKEGASLNRISEVKLAHAFRLIPFDFYRSGVAMFMTEVLGKSLYDHDSNEGLFDDLWDNILELDAPDVKLGIFPLAFLVSTSQQLGFGVDNADEFFLQVYEDPKGSPYALSTKNALDELLRSRFQSVSGLSKTERNQLLDDMLRFYQMHLDRFGEIKSLGILRSMMY